MEEEVGGIQSQVKEHLESPKARRGTEELPCRTFGRSIFLLTPCLRLLASRLVQSLRLLQPHGLQPTRLLCPWDFPGKNTDLSGLPFPYPRNLPNPEVELRPPALQADSLPTELPRKPFQIVREPLFLLRAIKSVINCYDRTGVLPQFSKSNISKQLQATPDYSHGRVFLN